MPDPSRYDGCDELLVQVVRMIWYIASSMFMGLSGLMIYLYYMKKGQFDDPEDVKYQLFRDEE
jgi:cbb3-type cytochrome oxidase maturation protein